MDKYRWVVLGAGTLAAASAAVVTLGTAAIAPQLRARYGISLQAMGFIFAATFVGQTVTLIPWGMAADRIGERTVMAVGLAVCAAALAATTLANGFTGLFLGLTVAGAAGACAPAASGRAVMQWFSQRERGLALGIRQTAIPIGGALGALLLPAITSTFGVHAAFGALAAGCAVCALGSSILLRDAPGGHDEDTLTAMGRPLRDVRTWVLCAGSIFVLAGQIATLSFVVLFLHDARGVSPKHAALVLAGLQVIGATLRVAGGRWSDRAGKRVPLFRRFALLIAASLALTAALTEAPLWVLVPVLLVAGGLGMSWNGLSFTTAAEIAGRARSGAALGLQQTALAVGAIAIPIVFAAVASSSWRIAFAGAAVCPIVGAVVLRPLRAL